MASKAKPKRVITKKTEFGDEGKWSLCLPFSFIFELIHNLTYSL